MSLLLIAALRLQVLASLLVGTMPLWLEISGPGVILTTVFGILGCVFAGLIAYATGD